MARRSVFGAALGWMALVVIACASGKAVDDGSGDDVGQDTRADTAVDAAPDRPADPAADPRFDPTSDPPSDSTSDPTDIGRDTADDLVSDVAADLGTDLGADLAADLLSDSGGDVGAFCGDGVTDLPLEQCDDQNTVNDDGCTGCVVDFGYTCNAGAVPSACTALPDLGTFGPGDSIDDTVETDALAEFESRSYILTVTDDVGLTGSVTAASGDPDVYIYDEDDVLVGGFFGVGTAEVLVQGLFAGSYEIVVVAFDPLPSGFTLSLEVVAPTDKGMLGVGGSFSEIQAATLTDGQVDWYQFEVTADALAAGSLTATVAEQDPDLYLFTDEGLDFLGTVVGDEQLRRVVEPRAYILGVVAYGTVQGYTLGLDVAAYADKGTYDLAEAIPNIVEPGPIALNDTLYYTMTFTERLLLGGTVTATAGNPNVRLTWQSGYWSDWNAAGQNEAFTLGLFPGRVVIEVSAAEALTNGYTLSLSTSALGPIGTFAAGAAIPSQDGGALAQGDSDWYSLILTEDVLLSGSVTADTTGDPDLYIFDDFWLQEVLAATGTIEPITNLELDAGVYLLQVYAYSAFDGYTLSLSTTAP